MYIKHNGLANSFFSFWVNLVSLDFLKWSLSTTTTLWTEGCRVQCVFVCPSATPLTLRDFLIIFFFDNAKLPVFGKRLIERNTCIKKNSRNSSFDSWADIQMTSAWVLWVNEIEGLKFHFCLNYPIVSLSFTSCWQVSCFNTLWEFTFFLAIVSTSALKSWACSIEILCCFCCFVVSAGNFGEAELQMFHSCLMNCLQGVVH